jgi:hypothetical protein
MSFVAALLVCAGSCMVAASEARASAEKKVIVVPTKVNIYKDSGVTRVEAQDYVRRANKILKKAMIRLDLRWRDINAGANGMGLDEPGDNSGSLTLAEREELRRTGKAELPGGKGCKIAMVKQPDASDDNVNGLSVDGEPAVILRENQTSRFRTAETIAHEFLHTLGLGHEADNGNLMSETKLERTGTKLTPDQVTGAMMAAKAQGQEKKKDKKGDGSQPARSVGTERGGAVAGGMLALGTAAHYRIASAAMDAVEEDTDYKLRLDLAGLTPEDAPAGTNYAFLFDTDNNPATGSTVNGRSGIERVVRAVSTGGLSAQYTIENGDGTGVTPLSGAFGHTEEDVELAGPGNYEAQPVADVLTIGVPRSLLQFEMGDVFPVTVMTADASAGVLDTLDMSLDRAYDIRGPQISADRGTYEPGQMMRITGGGFEPLEPLQVLLDDDMLAMTSADASGMVDLEVMAPIGLTPDFFFLTVAPPDEDLYVTGRVSLNGGATTFVNIPSPGMTLWSIVPGLLALRRRRECSI